MKTFKDRIAQKRSRKAAGLSNSTSASGGLSNATGIRVKRGKRFGKKWFPETKAE